MANSPVDCGQAEVREFLKLLRGPFAEYLSVGKIVASPRFLNILLSTTSFALARNAFDQPEVLINAFRGSPIAHQLQRWFNDRLGTEVIERNGRLHLKPKKGVAARVVNVADYFPEADRTRRESALAQQRLRVKQDWNDRRPDGDVDLMDTKLRLPGSFESGKKN